MKEIKKESIRFCNDDQNIFRVYYQVEDKETGEITEENEWIYEKDENGIEKFNTNCNNKELAQFIKEFEENSKKYGAEACISKCIELSAMQYEKEKSEHALIVVEQDAIKKTSFWKKVVAGVLVISSIVGAASFGINCIPKKDDDETSPSITSEPEATEAPVTTVLEKMTEAPVTTVAEKTTEAPVTTTQPVITTILEETTSLPKEFIISEKYDARVYSLQEKLEKSGYKYTNEEVFAFVSYLNKRSNGGTDFSVVDELALKGIIKNTDQCHDTYNEIVSSILSNNYYSIADTKSENKYINFSDYNDDKEVKPVLELLDDACKNLNNISEDKLNEIIKKLENKMTGIKATTDIETMRTMLEYYKALIAYSTSNLNEWVTNSSSKMLELSLSDESQKCR